MRRVIFRSVLGAILATMVAGAAAAQESNEAMIAEATSAAVPGVADAATVADWEGNVVREGTNGWTCLPSPPGANAVMPMCLDGPWMSWAEGWMTKTDPAIEGFGLAYMLRGDGGVSNSDPYATDPDAVDDWIEGGPHLMLVAPDPSIFDGIPTDPDNGGPWVMWKGTPYAHVMVPVLGPDGESGH